MRTMAGTLVEPYGEPLAVMAFCNCSLPCLCPPVSNGEEDCHNRRRHWPDEPQKWVKGVIADFKPDTNEHIITYNMHNPGKEQWEEYDFRYTLLYCGASGTDLTDHNRA